MTAYIRLCAVVRAMLRPQDKKQPGLVGIPGRSERTWFGRLSTRSSLQDCSLFADGEPVPAGKHVVFAIAIGAFVDAA